jgi:oligopeptide transport system substrate-binding protein
VSRPGARTGRSAGGRPDRAAVGLALVGVLLLAGCATGPPGPDTDPAGPTGPAAPAVTGVAAGPGTGGGTLRVGLAAEPISIDPRLVLDDAGELVARALFEGLVDVNPAGGITPAGAASWRRSADGTEYRFALRRATFHDGRAVTAQDHADALLAALDPARPPFGREGLLEGLLGAVVVDADGTSTRGGPGDVLAAGGIEVRGTWDLVLRLRAPDARLLHALTDIALAPIPPGADDDPSFATLPVGNGPFRLLEPRGDAGFLRLVAVEDHHRAPRIDELLLQFTPDDADGVRRWADLREDRLQIARVGGTALEEAVALLGRGLPSPPGPTAGVHDGPIAGVYAYAFDTTVPPFDDPRLRRALAAAIDRDGIAAVAGPAAAPATRLLPDRLVGAASQRSPCAHCTEDVELATALFGEWAAATEAELPLPLTLTYPRRSDHAAVAEELASQLERVLNVRVSLRALDLDGFTAAVAAGEAPLFRPALRATLGGAAATSSMLDPAFRSTAPRPDGGTGWGDPASDAVLDRLRGGADPAAAATVDAALTGDAVVLPLFWLRQDLVVAPSVRGFALDPTGRWWPELLSVG